MNQVDDLMALAVRCFSRLDDGVQQWQLREAIDHALTDAYLRGTWDTTVRLRNEADDERDEGDYDFGLDGRPNSERE